MNYSAKSLWFLLVVSWAFFAQSLPVLADDGQKMTERRFMPLVSANGLTSLARGVASKPRFMPLATTARNGGLKLVPFNGGKPVMKIASLKEGGVRRIAKAKTLEGAARLAATERDISIPQRAPRSMAALQSAGEVKKVAQAFAEEAPLTATLADSSSYNEMDLDDDDVSSLPLGEIEGPVPPMAQELKFQWPVGGVGNSYISSGYGNRMHPITHKHDFHAGIDIPAGLGTPVLAAAEGEVTEVNRGRALGNYIRIHHADGTETIYGHLRTASVHEGQIVQAGQRIGKVGSTGRSTGPHLHFGIVKGDKPLNPVAVLDMPMEKKTLASAR